MRYLKTLVFFVLGGPVLVLGGWRTIDPVSFYGFNELILVSEPGLLSEARGAGALVVGLAAIIVSGAFVRRLRPVSLLIAVALFYSYAMGRMLGLVVDGLPSEQVMQGLLSELILGSVALVAFLKHRTTERTPAPRPTAEAAT